MSFDKPFDNTNSGALFNNLARKREGKQDPDYTGRVNFNGEDGWLAGWVKISKKGEKYLSLKVTPLEPRSVAGNGAAARDDDTDGLAF